MIDPGSIPGGTVGLQTALIVVVLEMLNLGKKYAPLIFALLRGGAKAVEVKRRNHCSAHEEMVVTVKENTLAVKNLSAKAEEHHAQQHEDLRDLREMVEGEIHELRLRSEEATKELAEHGMAISFLREKD